METIYKLTDENNYTRKGESGETLWVVGKEVVLPIRPFYSLCSSDVIHAYKDINLGLLLNPIHANIKKPKLWECEGFIVANDWGKIGCQKLKIIKELPFPDWYVSQEIKLKIIIQFAILCAEKVIDIYEKQYPNDDRPRKAIKAAKDYLLYKSAAAHAAYAAARAAADAAYAAYAAYAAHAAYAAARAARAAADAAYAAYAAYAVDIDFIVLANKAIDLIINK